MKAATTPAAATAASVATALRVLDRSFFEQPVLELARALIGQLVVRRVGRVLRAGRIVETEAYGGRGVDPSAHGFRGPTPRCEVMFGPAGRAYVYSTHQGRCCLNVTCGGDGGGTAVLIRALEPRLGLERMRAARLAALQAGPTRQRLLPGAGRDHELAAGPARLCICLAIDRTLNGADLTASRSELRIVAAPASRDPAARQVLWTPRIGLNPRSASCGWHWRAVDAESKAVSPAAGLARRTRRAPRPRCHGAGPRSSPE